MVIDSKASHAARPFLDSGEELVGAFFAETGPKPGVEGFSVLALGAVLVSTSNYVAALLVAIAIFAGVAISRRHMVVALTDQGLIQIDGGLRRVPQPGARVARVRPNLLFAEAGDPYATVQGRKVWVRGDNQDEAQRVARLAAEDPE